MEKRRSGYRFQPSWRASLLLALFLPLFTGLGFWQLQRAGEKAALNALREARAQEAPIRLGSESPETLDDFRYHPVEATGEYDPAHQFLLDNQLEGSTPGYHVLTPLKLAGSDQAVLINRGWAPLGPSRTILPALAPPPAGQVRVSGTLDRFHRVGFRLQGAEIPAPGWPSLVQLPEPEALAERLGYPLLPYQVLLDPSAVGGFSRHWRETPLDPGKNQGYALQWFLFAACAVLLFLRHGLTRKAA